VRSVGSVRRYGGPERDPIGAARDLSVVWIIDGTVQRSGSQVRVTARLLNTASGEAAWSGSFDERFTNVFDLRTAGLRKSLDLYRQALALDPDYALACVGIAESNRRMIFGADGEPMQTFAEAKRHAQRAVEIAPDLAEAHASIGWNRFWHD